MSTPYFVPHWPKSGGQKNFSARFARRICPTPLSKPWRRPWTDCLVYNLKVIYIQMFEVASDHSSFCFYSRPGFY